MEQEHHRQYQKLFEQLPHHKASRKLVQSVFFEIEAARKHATQMKFGMVALSGGASLALFIPAIFYTLSKASQSGFATYLALAFSDSGTLLLYWKEFGIALLESLPVVGMAIILTALLVLLGVIRFIAQYSRTMITHQFA